MASVVQCWDFEASQRFGIESKLPTSSMPEKNIYLDSISDFLTSHLHCKTSKRNPTTLRKFDQAVD